MKKLPLFILISAIPLLGCDKSEDNPSSDNVRNGKKLEGKWTPTSMKITLKFDDGSVVNQTVPIKDGDYLEFTYQKTTGNNSEGAYRTRGVGFETDGTWLLEHANNELTYTATATDGTVVVLYRKIDTLSDSKLILTADDRLVKLWAEVNDLNQSGQKKVTGGSAYEEYVK